MSGFSQTAKQVRGTGGWLVTLSLLLLAATGVATFSLAPGLLHPLAETRGRIFVGSATQGILILALFALAILFGVNTLIGGIRQLTTGRRKRDKWTFACGIVLLALMCALDYTLKVFP